MDVKYEVCPLEGECVNPTEIGTLSSTTLLSTGEPLGVNGLGLGAMEMDPIDW